MRPVVQVTTGGLFLLAVWLGSELWRAELEHAASQADVSAQKRELATLHTRLESTMTAPTAKPESEPARGAAEAKATMAGSAASIPVDPRIARRKQQMFRRGAFELYTTGLDRLQLPPDTLALAKEIILDHGQAVRNLPKQGLTFAQRVEDADRLNNAMDDQLTELLGPEAVVEIESAGREESIDWTIGTDMWDGGAPLDSDQLRALARAEVQTGYRSLAWALPESTDLAPDPQTGLSQKDSALLAATSGFLSQAQQAILQRSLIEDHQYNAAMRAFLEKQRKLQKPP